MKRNLNVSASWSLPALLLASAPVHAEIQGIGGGACPDGVVADACFNLTAKSAHIVLGDGNSLLAWGYADGNGLMQYPGPTLVVTQGQSVAVTLSNELPDYLGADVATSIVFPGQAGVVATGGAPGLLTNETTPGSTVTYRFMATEPGTYLYQSGTQPELQIEMGLVGALVVRPSSYAEGSTNGNHNGRRAYNQASTRYDREYLFFLTDMDRAAHDAVDQGLPADPASFFATLWFINGRNGPDTMHANGASWLPNQPYGALAQAKPSERVLMRLVGAGRDLHPFHHHGNNAWVIAQDGRRLGTGTAPYPDFAARPGFEQIPAHVGNNQTLPDQSISNFTIQVVPGNTYDAIFTWTGFGLNWDVYGNRAGHTAGDCDAGALLPTEDPNSHCKDLTVVLPEQQALTFGGLWTGSPYLGVEAALPPGQGGLNPNFGFSYMWHSHTEKELANDDIFPGGMMTMMVVEAPDVCLPDSSTVCP